jgi:hypothetical protein
MDWECSTHGKYEECIHFGRKNLKRRFERHVHRRGYNVRIDLRDIGSKVVDWINFAQDRDQWRSLVKVVMHHRIP